MNAGPDDLCIGWDRAINNGRLDVYDLLVGLAEAGHQGLQAESILWRVDYVAESIRHACMPLSHQTLARSNRFGCGFKLV